MRSLNYEEKSKGDRAIAWECGKGKSIRRILLKKLLVAVVLAASFVLSGCGGSDGWNQDYPYNDYPYNDGYYPDNPYPPQQSLVAYYDSYDGVIDTLLDVDAFGGVLNNDIYTIGATYIEFPTRSQQGGVVRGYGDGSFEYEPPSGFTGNDEFRYTLTNDAGRESSATVYLHIYPQ